MKPRSAHSHAAESIISRGREYFEKNGQPGLHSAVEFDGVLTVTDPAEFHRTFTLGIGSAKAFGFGLLVIAPIS
jgi:CRISPR system Cascade subunit CasE